MQRTTIVKALSITLLLSCTTHVGAMSKKASRQEARERNKQLVMGGGQTTASQAPSGNTGSVTFSPALQAQLGDKPIQDMLQEAATVQGVHTVQDVEAAPQAPTSQAVKELTDAAFADAQSDEKKDAVAQLVAQAPAAQTAIKTLLGKELVALYNTDDKPLVQKPSLWGRTDATVPYKDEGRLINGLEKKDESYLKDVQAQQDLNRTLNHICAGIIQKIKEQSTLEDTGTRTFSVQQIEMILDSQFPRAMELNKILTLCKARIDAKQEPILYPAENAKELAQRCFAALSQLQLERKRIRTTEENDRIRQIKEGQRMTFQMRLTADKGSISEDEYSDEFIFDKTTNA